MELEELLERQLERAIRLMLLKNLNAPQRVIEIERRLCRESNEDIEPYEKKLGEKELAEIRKRVYTEFLEAELRCERAKSNSSYCPVCRWKYFYPDSKEVPEEVLNQYPFFCSLNPGRPEEIIQANIKGKAMTCGNFSELYRIPKKAEEIEILEELLYAVG